jgi:hypothetical protein
MIEEIYSNKITKRDVGLDCYISKSFYIRQMLASNNGLYEYPTNSWAIFKGFSSEMTCNPDHDMPNNVTIVKTMVMLKENFG